MTLDDNQTPAHNQDPGRQVLDAAGMRRVIASMVEELVDIVPDPSRLLLVGIRTRGVPLAEELAVGITDLNESEVPLGTLDITLYRDDLSTIAPHPVVGETRLPGNLDGRTVVLCDDVLFTGRTIRAALDALMDFGRPRSVRLAVLVDRGGRELPIQADVVGETVEADAEHIVDVRFAATDPGPEGIYVRARTELDRAGGEEE